ncbi:MAG TPA: DciA family protein [Thermoanaerobaculia bacterium]|nr:DciA family protein [Thermoanaerobaculia bacterium]
MKGKSRSSFTRLDVIADGFLRSATKGESTLTWLQARWGQIVGEPLSRKIQPTSLHGRTLTVSLLDAAWRKPVQATLPELERKLAVELPAVKPRVVLR